MNATTFALDDEVTVTAGRAAGYEGVIDEIDGADLDLPYRVRFDQEGDPVAWFGPADLARPAGVR